MDASAEMFMLKIDTQMLLKKIKEHNDIYEITVQAPEGLKRRTLEIAEILERTGYTVFISADPCYGACDLKEYGDLLLHVGHTEMYSPKIPVIYVTVYDDFDFVPTLRENLDKIPKTVGLLTTGQHKHELQRVQSFLEKNGIQPILGKGVRTRFDGQILGCDLTAAVTVQDRVEAFLFLGTGIFHPLGAAIATKKSVFRVYDSFERIDPRTFLKRRHAFIYKASLGQTYGIVMSTKKGQFRKKEALKIREYLKEKGKTTYLFVADEIRPDILYGCDAYIICACPRIALDDSARFEPPVLTCSEVRLMFEDRPYEMDMIV